MSLFQLLIYFSFCYFYALLSGMPNFNLNNLLFCYWYYPLSFAFLRIVAVKFDHNINITDTYTIKLLLGKELLKFTTKQN